MAERQAESNLRLPGDVGVRSGTGGHPADLFRLAAVESLVARGGAAHLRW
jgi:hypothetical protein